jgi:hypothetical protein
LQLASNNGTVGLTMDTSQNVGIGTSSPAVKLDVNGINGWSGGTTGQTAQIVGASSGIVNGGNFRVLSNTTQAADVGGALTLGGYFTSTTASVDFASILGAKENSTGGNTAGYLAFGTRPNAGNTTERMRIDSSGNVGIGINAPTGRLTVVSGTSPNIATLLIGYSGSNNYYDANTHYFRNGSQVTRLSMDSLGTLSSSTSIGYPNLDTGGTTGTYAASATQDFGSLSGIIIANSNTSGYNTIWICGGGSVTLIANANGANNNGTLAYQSSVNGYRWTNTSGVSNTTAFFVIKTRPGA